MFSSFIAAIVPISTDTSGDTQRSTAAAPSTTAATVPGPAATAGCFSSAAVRAEPAAGALPNHQRHGSASLLRGSTLGVPGSRKSYSTGRQ